MPAMMPLARAARAAFMRGAEQHAAAAHLITDRHHAARTRRARGSGSGAMRQRGGRYARRRCYACRVRGAKTTAAARAAMRSGKTHPSSSSPRVTEMRTRSDAENGPSVHDIDPHVNVTTRCRLEIETDIGKDENSTETPNLMLPPPRHFRRLSFSDAFSFSFSMVFMPDAASSPVAARH